MFEACSTPSTTEYWDINGTTAANITLNWRGSYPGSIIMVGWSGTQWVKIPATILGTTSAGSVTSIAAISSNTYTVYTLASAATPNLTISKTIQAGAIPANTN